MKKITVTNAAQAVETGENSDKRLCSFEIEGPEHMDASDGYHTFSELYDHRHALFIQLAGLVASLKHLDSDQCPLTHAGAMARPVWRSHQHADGSMFSGMFILGIGKAAGEQITYHLPVLFWVETDFAETLEHAPAWDGHTPADVVRRLRQL